MFEGRDKQASSNLFITTQVRQPGVDTESAVNLVQAVAESHTSLLPSPWIYILSLPLQTAKNCIMKRWPLVQYFVLLTGA